MFEVVKFGDEATNASLAQGVEVTLEDVFHLKMGIIESGKAETGERNGSVYPGQCPIHVKRTRRILKRARAQCALDFAHNTPSVWCGAVRLGMGTTAGRER